MARPDYKRATWLWVFVFALIAGVGFAKWVMG